MLRLLSGIGLVLGVCAWGCSSREAGTCERDSHCTGAEVCFEKKCISMKDRKAIEDKRAEEAKPKVCEDKDGDGARAGSGCPAGEALDCNDKEKEQAPTRTELCDALDNDCDGMNNEGLKGCVQTLLGGPLKPLQAHSVVFDPAGFVLLSDNHRVWKVRLDGTAEVLAGHELSHAADGHGAEARFSYPRGLARLADGSVLVADCKNNCVRKVSPSGDVSTLAGHCSTATKEVGQFADGGPGAARFYCPSDLAVAPDGAVIVVDQGNARIRRIDPGGQVTTLAGVGPADVQDDAGQDGFLDGPALQARFNDPQAVLVDGKGVIYVSESFNCRIRRLDPSKGDKAEVTTLAGESDTWLGIGGYQDGAGKGAKFNYPHGLAWDADGNLLVADTGNSAVRVVTPAGKVRTLYGKPQEGKPLSVDGPIPQARFDAISDIAPGPNGSLFVVDAGQLRWIVP
ncbi:MAG TPA: MopE-related protein [Myxococcota bacterium]|nr:MopE-related protein [Myxococcota bacterium]HRY96422.1 MopE-related protein [Myxococcota bacterium]